MPERPLVLFAQPTLADRGKRNGGGGKYHVPSYDRQIARIAPKFEVLQDALNRGDMLITNAPDAIDPEYTLVFETIGDPSGFYRAIHKLKEQYPNVEWVMELSDNCPNDDDFYAVNKNKERDDTKALSTKVFCIMTNQAALRQILSLWNNFRTNEQFVFAQGFAGFKHLFKQLYDVHQWGIQERIEDTGLLEDWQNDLQETSQTLVKAEIELFFRTSDEKRMSAERRVRELIEAAEGSVIDSCLIPEIRYHALLATFPRAYAETVLRRDEIDLVLADEIMFIKGTGQTVSVGLAEQSDEIATPASPAVVYNEPIVALFDGMPQENHPLLSGLLTVDDPDAFASNYPVDERLHGTSMSSLILRGKNMNGISERIHKLYVRPIMKSCRWEDDIDEFIPDDFIIVDKIYECVRRLFEPVAGNVAPTVRVINLSIGIKYREYYNLITPLARLLDWLSYKYRVLFIVSAGNHTDLLQLDCPFDEYAALSSEDKDKFISRYISSNIRKLRLLSPAESMNALTVGATFDDSNNETLYPNMTTLCSDGMPAAYGSFGRGINKAIKPDILYDGGRKFIRKDYQSENSASFVISTTRKPGIQSAYPDLNQAGTGAMGYSCGTSNSAALISNKASECYNVLNEVFISARGENLPYDYAAVLIKAMIAHGASWPDNKNVFINSLNLSGRQTKNELHKYYGYGKTDVDRVKECTKNQVTLIGYGDIRQGQAFLYDIPLPFDFHTQKYKRRLTVTLAYFSPIHPSSIKYREKQVWFTLDNGSNIAGSREEYDYNAVLRGSLQHEIFESDSVEVWDANNSLTIKVNCRGDASEQDDSIQIPYAIFATFEMAPEYDIDVYQPVVDRVRIRETIAPTVE